MYFYHEKTYQIRRHILKPAISDPGNLENFVKTALPSKSIINIIEEHGLPYYIKIDVEHYDAQILRALFNNNIRPPYISSESHNIEVFSLLVCLGNYAAFKLVDGHTVSKIYSNSMIQCNQGNLRYTFPYHSAGPLGNDINGKWMAPESLFYLLAYVGLGWKDIHATNQEIADSSAIPTL